MMADDTVQKVLDNIQGQVSCNRYLDNLLLPEQLAVTLTTCCYHDNVLLP